MGSQPEEVDQVELISRMLKIFVLFATVVFVKSTEDILREIKQNVDQYNFKSECWGRENVDKFYLAQLKATKKCLQMEPTIDVISKLTPAAANNPFSPLSKPFENPFQKLVKGDLSEIQSLWRNKRQISSEGGYIGGDENDVEEFVENFWEFGSNVASSIANLTCVLQEMEVLDAEGKVILDSYIKSFEDEKYDVSISFSKDPVFVESMKTGYKDCYQISQNWPEQALKRNPISREFGRNMVFFKCAKRVEKRCCLQGIMKEWLEKLYGNDPNEDLTQYGLPENRYKAAEISMMVRYHSATSEEKFVGDFFWGME